MPVRNNKSYAKIIYDPSYLYKLLDINNLL